MNALLKKEVRLLLPAWVAALVMASVSGLAYFGGGLGHLLAALGATLLAVAPFGRELSHSTLALLLVQPANRAQVWRLKFRLLLASAVLVFGVWALAQGYYVGRLVGRGFMWSPESWLYAASYGLAILATGLWSTLLLRHVSGAVALTLLLPLVVFVVPRTQFLGGLEEVSQDVCSISLLTAYGIAGCGLARWLFLRAQEPNWAGSTMSFPLWRRTHHGARTQPGRSRRPGFWRLWRKELHLQLPALLLLVGWVGLHLGLLACIWLSRDGLPDWVASVQAVTWLAWGVVPLLSGALAFAEERSLGVHESQLCLPVHRWLTFGLKLLAVSLVGAGSPLICLQLVVKLAAVANLPMSSIAVIQTIYALSTLGLLGGVALLAAYASSLARNTLQALGLAVIFGVVGLALALGLTLVVALVQPGSRFGFELWRRPLLDFIVWPGLALTVLGLTYRNQRTQLLGWRIWRINLVSLAVALGLLLVGTTLVYHRVWEFGMTPEPAHGPARLRAPQQLAVSRGYSDGGVWGVDADGRLWAAALNDGTSFYQPAPQFGTIAGINNSVVVAANSVGMVLNSDGSLDEIRSFLGRIKFLKRCDNSTNWQSLAAGGSHFLAIQRDGSLWAWGDNRCGQLGAKPRISVLFPPTNYNLSFHQELAVAGGAVSSLASPTRVDSAVDWARVYAAWDTSYAAKRDGSLWVWGLILKESGIAQPPSYSPLSKPMPLGSAFAVPWRAMGSYGLRTLALHPDGSLWAWVALLAEDATGGSRVLAEPTRLSGAPLCSALLGSGGYLLTQQGEIWQCNFAGPIWDASQPRFKRISRKSDWVAIGADRDLFALAADGSLVTWAPRYSRLLAPSRWPWRVGSIPAEAP